MSHNSEISKAERRRLAVASATLGPWRAAAAVGGLGGGVALALGTIDDGIGLGLGVVAGAVSVALMLFFMVGGAGAVLGEKAGAAEAGRAGCGCGPADTALGRGPPVAGRGRAWRTDGRHRCGGASGPHRAGAVRQPVGWAVEGALVVGVVGIVGRVSGRRG